MSPTRAAAALAAALLFSAPASADRWDKLDDRIRALEAQRDGAQISQQIQALEQDLRTLRGHIEEMDYALQQLRGQQDKNAALEARIRTLEEALIKARGQLPPAGGEGGTAPNPAVTEIPAGPPGVDEQNEYQAAFDLLKQGRYPDASASFRAFLVKYPRASYSDRAYYWLGQALQANKELPAALVEYEKVVSQFPQSSKMSEALLQIGFIHYDLGDFANARLALEKVRTQFAGSSVAELAAKRLDRMKSEGH